MSGMKFKMQRFINKTFDKTSETSIILLHKNGTISHHNIALKKKTWSHDQNEYLLSADKRFIDGRDTVYVLYEEYANPLPIMHDDVLNSTEFYAAINNKVIDRLNQLDKVNQITLIMIMLFICIIMVGISLYFDKLGYDTMLSLSEYIQSITG